MKKFLFYGFMPFVLLIFFLAGQIIYFGYNSKPKKADCIIVLGCKVRGNEPSHFLKARLNLAIELFENGYAKYIIVSGGQGKNENISEAEAMQIYLKRKGVKEKYIIKEDKSYSTYENLLNSMEIMKYMGFKDAIIVSNKYHLKRASLIANKLGIRASYAGCFVTDWLYFEITGFIREILALLKFYIFNM